MFGFEEIWRLFEEEMAKRDNADYTVDRAQMQKLVDTYGVFEKLARECGGSIEPFRIVPKEVNGGVTAYFQVFSVFGENVARFCDAVRGASALSIDSLTDGRVCISMTIPGVFKHK